MFSQFSRQSFYRDKLVVQSAGAAADGAADCEAVAAGQQQVGLS